MGAAGRPRAMRARCVCRRGAPLSELMHLVAFELVSEVCSVCHPPGDILELVATEGMNPAGHRPHAPPCRRGYCRPVRRHRPGDEPAGRAEPPAVRLPAGNRRGTLRLHAAVPVRRAGRDSRRGRGAEPQSPRHYRRGSGRTRNGRDAAGRDCWPRSAPRTAPERGRCRDRAAGVRRSHRWSPASLSGRSCCTAAAPPGAPARGRPRGASSPACTTRPSACSRVWTN